MRADAASLSPEEARQTLHELRVHQIELEMQNDELRRTQADLEASRARYVDLYDLAPVGYVTLGEQGLILEANLTAAQLLSVERSALVQQPLTRFIAPDGLDTSYHHHKQVIETGAPQACDLPMRRADGAPLWVRSETISAPDVAGAPVCRAVMSNITPRVLAEHEQQQAAEALRQSEAVYRRLFEGMMDGFAKVTMSGDIVDANPALLALLGYSKAEILKLRDQDITPGRWHAFEQAVVETEILPRGYSDSYE